MRKVLLALLILAVVSPCLAKYSGGAGDPNTPYQIANVADLMTLADDTNDYNKCFIMTADIDLDSNLPGNKVFNKSVIAWDGNLTAEFFNGVEFTGTFDGMGHKICNLTIDANRTENWYIGFFGIIDGGEVKNLGLENVTITTISGSYSYCVGALAGVNNASIISGCYSTGTIADFARPYQIGGLVGSNQFQSSIVNCYSLCSVTTGDMATCVGGLTGVNYSSTISTCYSTGGVNVGSYSVQVGGFVGYRYVDTINNSYFLTGCGPNNGAGTPLTDTQMKQQSSFVGWDFVWETVNGPNDVWAICEGASYPKLAWQYISGDSDNDKDVDFADFALISNKWRQADSNLYCGGTDLTGDGWVDLDDLAAFANNWLQ